MKNTACHKEVCGAKKVGDHCINSYLTPKLVVYISSQYGVGLRGNSNALNGVREQAGTRCTPCSQCRSYSQGNSHLKNQE